MGRWFDTSSGSAFVFVCVCIRAPDKPRKQKDTDEDKSESIDAKRALSEMWNQDEKEMGNAFIGIV